MNAEFDGKLGVQNFDGKFGGQYFCSPRMGDGKIE
jgi:hypothetical protein